MAIMDAEEGQVNAKAQMHWTWENDLRNWHKEKTASKIERMTQKETKAKRWYIQRPTSRRRKHNQPEMNEAPK